MTVAAPELKTRILARIADAPPRTVWTANDFLDLGRRDAVDKTLQRLAKAETLQKVDRGLYHRPTFNTLTQQPNPADVRAVIDAVARRDQIRVLVDGMTAANDLGLTNAVPAQTLVHVDARLRPIRLGDLEIKFRPTAPSKLHWASRPAMRLVQALHWLRDVLGQQEEGERIRRAIARLLDDPKEGARLRADLQDGFTTLPAWMQDELRPFLASATPASAP